jgi:hypothetical protein
LNPNSLQGAEWLRQRVFAAAFSPCLQIRTSIDLFADSRGNIPMKASTRKIQGRVESTTLGNKRGRKSWRGNPGEENPEVKRHLTDF